MMSLLYQAWQIHLREDYSAENNITDSEVVIVDSSNFQSGSKGLHVVNVIIVSSKLKSLLQVVPSPPLDIDNLNAPLSIKGLVKTPRYPHPLSKHNPILLNRVIRIPS